MRSVLIGLVLAVALGGAPGAPHAGQAPASVAGHAAPDDRPDAAVTAPGSYDPRAVFAPLTLPEPVNRYRSANGAPGPGLLAEPRRLRHRRAPRAQDQDLVRRRRPSPTPTTARTRSTCSGCSSTRTSTAGTPARAPPAAAPARSSPTATCWTRSRSRRGGKFVAADLPGQRHAAAGASADAL